MQIDLQKILNYSLMLLAICGGVIAGSLAGQLADLLMSTGEISQPVMQSAPQVVATLKEADFQVILDRNLFDSQAVSQPAEKVDLSARLTAEATASPAPARGEMELIGTVVAGEDSLALIQVGRKASVYRLLDEVSPGVKVTEITRLLVALMDHGVRQELLLKQRKQEQPKLVRRSGPVAAGGVVALGENRWQVSRTAAENARANLNTLLQTARMIPQLQNGKTVGFKLVELEKGSLLEQVGLRVGDLVVEINQVELNSPEKALQIFQQVREASNISLGLVRNGQRQTFEYSFE